MDSIIAALAIATAIAWVGWSYWSGGIIEILLNVNLEPAAKIANLREVFLDWGILAPVIYVMIVIVEVVVAPIPGAILYLPGGVIFGGFWGGTLSLIGNILGACICCFLMRTIVGRSWSNDFFSEGKLQNARDFILKHGLLSVALLRINPLTSSDLVSYAAGLTPLSISTVMIGTGIGMFPLCYAQAYLSVGIFTLFPWLLWPLVASCLLYVILAAMAIWKLQMPPSDTDNVAS